MAHYLFTIAAVSTANAPSGTGAAVLLRAGMWGVRAGEPHRDALRAGDLVIVHVGAPERAFTGRAQLASAARDWTPSEALRYPGDSPGGVLLAHVEEWDPPVPVDAVLSRLDPAENARGDFREGVARITSHEYRTVLAVADMEPLRSRHLADTSGA